MALHALLYCERLFYLEEVEEIRVADAAVYAGRRLHDDVVPLDDEVAGAAERRGGERGLGAGGQGRCGPPAGWGGSRTSTRRAVASAGRTKRSLAWPSDRIQAIAYAVLLEEALGEPVPQARDALSCRQCDGVCRDRRGSS